MGKQMGKIISRPSLGHLTLEGEFSLPELLTLLLEEVRRLPLPREEKEKTLEWVPSPSDGKWKDNGDGTWTKELTKEEMTPEEREKTVSVPPAEHVHQYTLASLDSDWHICLLCGNMITGSERNQTCSHDFDWTQRNPRCTKCGFVVPPLTHK